jgi:hypothetical protein
VNFKSGFEKKAFIGPALAAGARLAGKGLLGLGKGVVRMGGGPLNTALTGISAASDYGDVSKKMRQAAQR